MWMSEEEHTLFEREQKKFETGYDEALEQARIRAHRGFDKYDRGSVPIWLRGAFPLRFIDELKDRANRLSTTTDLTNFQDPDSVQTLVDKILDEVPDLINYAAYLQGVLKALGYGGEAPPGDEKSPVKVLGPDSDTPVQKPLPMKLGPGA